MLCRHGIHRLVLCIAFVLAASHAQAAVNVSLWQTDAIHDEVNAEVTPCSHGMEMDSEKGGTHKSGCCSNFACCLGLVPEAVVPDRAVLISTRNPIRVRAMRSTLFPPLFPPPKSV